MKNFIKKIGAVSLSLTVAASLLAGCGAKTTEPADASASKGTFRTLEEIKSSGTINIGVFSDKSPFGYVDENGEYQGYDVYFANRIGEDLGVKINYVSTEAANRIEYLQTGKVDIILANFTVTPERAQEVDFALPYMNVALGVVSPEDAVITSLDEIGADDQVIVISGTTAETYLEKNNPEIKLQKYDAYAEAKTAFENGNGVAWANDNTEVIAFSIENPGYVVGIPSLGSADTIAPAVTKGNTTLLNWLNDEIKALGNENFFHADYEATLLDTYGKDYEDTLVVEGGAAAGAEAAETVEPKGTITVAASPTPHAEILAEAAKLLAKEGWTLEVTEFEDYVQPNLVVDSGEIDANYFQHTPYLDDFNEKKGTDLVAVAAIHYEPFGIYPGTKTALSDLADGDVIAVPNDTTNEARALLLLEANGIIKLKDGAGITATKNDIAENPYNVEIVEAEAAQLPNMLKDFDYAVINSNYAINAGLNPVKDSLAIEGAASAYVNVLVVKEGNENAPKILALKAALESKQVVDYINEKYNGSVVSVVENPTDGYDASIDYSALNGETVSIAATPAPHAEILEIVKNILAEKGITLKIQVVNDYVTPNTFVEDGSIDANYFQHLPYLEDFNAQQGTHLVSVAGIHVEPMGLYGGKQTTLDAVSGK